MNKKYTTKKCIQKAHRNISFRFIEKGNLTETMYLREIPPPQTQTKNIFF